MKKLAATLAVLLALSLLGCAKPADVPETEETPVAELTPELTPEPTPEPTVPPVVYEPADSLTLGNFVLTFNEDGRAALEDADDNGSASNFIGNVQTGGGDILLEGSGVPWGFYKYAPVYTDGAPVFLNYEYSGSAEKAGDIGKELEPLLHGLMLDVDGAQYPITVAVCLAKPAMVCLIFDVPAPEAALLFYVGGEPVLIGAAE